MPILVWAMLSGADKAISAEVSGEEELARRLNQIAALNEIVPGVKTCYGVSKASDNPDADSIKLLDKAVEIVADFIFADPNSRDLIR